MQVFPNSSSSGTITGHKTTVATTDATVTTIDTIEVPTGQAILLNARVISRNDAFDEKGGFDVEAVYCNDTGTVTLQGVAPTNLFKQAQAGWNVTFVISGTNVLIRVKGAAATNIDWKCARQTLKV